MVEDKEQGGVPIAL